MTALLVAALIQPAVWRDYDFVVKLPEEAKTVSVAGTFNDWNKDRNFLKVDPDHETWRAKVRVRPGKHLYKYILNGETWILDPGNPRSEDDGNGHTNSVLLISPPGFESTAVKGDGKITSAGLLHTPGLPDVNYDRGLVTLRFTTRTGDIQHAYALVNGQRLEMRELAGGDEFFTSFEVQVAWNRMRPFAYAFVAKDRSTELYYGRDGVRNRDPFLIEPKKFMPFEVPNWVERTVFYQIFPDRFANGSKSNDPKDTEDWKTGTPTYSNWFGGDAAGISGKIPYLQDLGVNGVYINPIMAGNSNHRYDPCDFYKVDPPFGTSEEFAELTRKLQKAGIRTVLDQIFDHVGIKFGPFLDVLKNQQKSKYLDWFKIKSFPVEVRQNPPYEGWWGTEYMPKVDMNNPEVRKYMLESVRFWMGKAQLSGWRLDVANEVPMEFWRVFRQEVKKLDPQAWIVGEVWYNGAPWLGGDQWDASMNYPFRDQAVRFIAEDRITATQFLNGLMQVYRFTAPQVSRNQLNLLSSHDTERFLHLAKGDTKLQALAATLQMTWVGAPSIYYGEEIGMPGGRDPDNRRPMDWDKVTRSNELLTHYKKLIQLRTRSRVLASGDPYPLLANDEKKVVAFGRVLFEEAMMTVLNRSDKPQTISIPVQTLPEAAIDTIKREGLIGEDGRKFKLSQSKTITVTLGPVSGLILGTPDSGIRSKKSYETPQGGKQS